MVRPFYCLWVNSVLVSVKFWRGFGFSLLCNDMSGDFMTRRGRISCGCHFLV